MYITTTPSTFKAFFSEGGRLLAVFEFEFEFASTGVVDNKACERERDSACAEKKKENSGKSMPWYNHCIRHYQGDFI